MIAAVSRLLCLHLFIFLFLYSWYLFINVLSTCDGTSWSVFLCFLFNCVNFTQHPLHSVVCLVFIFPNTRLSYFSSLSLPPSILHSCPFALSTSTLLIFPVACFLTKLQSWTELIKSWQSVSCHLIKRALQWKSHTVHAHKHEIQQAGNEC